MNILVSVILFAKHLLCSTWIDNISCMIRDYGRQWLFFNLMSESFNPLLDLELNTNLKNNCHRIWEQHPLRDQIRQDQRISAGRKMHYWCQHDSINVSMDLVKEPTKLGATIGNGFMITSIPMRISPQPATKIL